LVAFIIEAEREQAGKNAGSSQYRGGSGAPDSRRC